jgi:hypothetical protein
VIENPATSSPDTTPTNGPHRGEFEKTMLFPIIIFLTDPAAAVEATSDAK